MFRVLQITYYLYVMLCGTAKAVRRRFRKKED